MIEIVEKVSNQFQKVENMCSESMLVIDGEFRTPPVNQARITIPVKLNNTPNLPMFSGQELVPSTEGPIDQWLFQVEGALATHTEEAVNLAVIGYGKEMDVMIRHIKEHF